ncbi:MAG: type IV pilin [Thermoplasmata archaeon]|nr:type IV pilin [Thermoplasmata archaeon]
MTKIENIRKWVKNKAGVSPIIAIILMVAITVVLAATIYVWVSGMGGGGGTKIALSLQQDAVDDTSSTDDGNANTSDYVQYEVMSVNGGPGWEDVKIKVGGTTVWDGTANKTETGWTVEVNGGSIDAGAISAGDKLKIENADESEIDVGDTVSIIDADSGSVIWSAEIHY